MRYRYRSEEELKDSGIEWIGKIPKNWTISRIDKEFKVSNEKVSDKEFAPLSVTKQGILPQLENVAKSDNSDNRKKVCKGDFVINSRADRKGSCGVSSFDGSVSLICNVLTPKQLYPQYVHSLFRNYYFSEEFYRWGSGIVDDLWSTNIERMKKINIPIPSGNEDIKIANFLDEKTSQFDLIISKKEDLIKSLEEAKKSLISEVVTGKVKVVKNDEGYELVKRSSEEMKDSGVEWLGEIPKDWEVSKIKYVISEPLKYGANESAELEDRKFPRYIRITDFKDNGELKEYTFKSLSFEKAKDYLIKEGDILFARSGGTVGKTFLFKNYDGIACFAGYLIKASPNINKVKSEFLYAFTKSKGYENWKNSIFMQATIQNIGADKYKELKFSIPSITEQNKICEYLQYKENNFNKLIKIVNYQIKKLKEAKQSLISEAVTGKIEILD